jgi:hypothetical protein
LGKDIVFSPHEAELENSPFNHSAMASPHLSEMQTTTSVKETLRRSQSYSGSSEHDRVLSRNLSFGDISSALGTSPMIMDSGFQSLAEEKYVSEVALMLKKHLDTCKKLYLEKSQDQVRSIGISDLEVARKLDQIDKTYIQLLIDYEVLQQTMTDTITNSRASLGDILAKVEGVASKLEYELNVLTSKVEDVEDGIIEFEDQVLSLEERAQALEMEESKEESWTWRLARLFLGFD